MLKNLLKLLILCSFFTTVSAQEFRCGVSVNYQKLQSTTQQYETADIKTAVSSVLMSKTFDNGVICASEQSVICVDSAYERAKEELQSFKRRYKMLSELENIFSAIDEL